MTDQINEWADGLVLTLEDFADYGVEKLDDVYGELVLNVLQAMADEDEVELGQKRETGPNSFHLEGEEFTWSVDDEGILVEGV